MIITNMTYAPIAECKIHFEAYEDNGGGVILFILNEDNSVIEAFSGFEYQEYNSLTLALNDLSEDKDSWKSWDNKESINLVKINISPNELYAQYQNIENDLICDNQGVYINRLGSSGCDVLNIDIEQIDAYNCYSCNSYSRDHKILWRKMDSPIGRGGLFLM